MWRGGYHSLPKYLRTVFLALGLEPRPSGQALAVSITLVSLRQAGPGHREGRREEAGAWLPLRGGWATQNSSRCLRLPPTAHPPGRSLVHPKGSSLLTQERWGSWGQGGGLPGSQAGGGSHHSCLPSPGSDNPAPQELDSPRARLGQTSCSLPHILGGKLSLEAEPTGKNNQGA